VAARLRAEGFLVQIVGDGPSAVEAARRTPPDLIVLDVMLPGFDGLEVCRRIQAERPVPVLMLTARGEETDLLVGLAVGADDYMAKPFSMRELAARVHALLRRASRAAAGASAAPVLRLGDLVINEAERRVLRGGVEVHLTPTEFDLLVHLAARPRTVLPRERLLADVWGLGGRVGHPYRRQPHQGAPPQVGLGPHPHGAWGWLCPGGRAVMRALAWLPRPLDPVRSIKMKIIMVLVAAGGGGMLWFSLWLRWFPFWTGLTSVIIGVTITQFLAHGMTSPLREMTAAARAMAHGDYTRRVRATSQDEVGELAVAFQPDGGGPGGRRPAAARADRKRLARVAYADHRAARASREHCRRGGPGRAGDDADRADPDRTAGPAGRRAARPVPAGRGRDGAEPRADRRAVVPRRRRPRGRGQRGRRGPRRAFRGVRAAVVVPATGSGCTRSSRTCSTTPPGTARPAAPSTVRAERRGDHVLLAVADEGDGIPAADGTGCSSASPAANGPGTAAPGWGWPSPAGWCNCTTARSRSSIPPGAGRSVLAGCRKRAGRTGCHIHVTLPLLPA
jgi:DNA-binding response OmpR family regulator/HAMP domain-containing protein